MYLNFKVLVGFGNVSKFFCYKAVLVQKGLCTLKNTYSKNQNQQNQVVIITFFVEIYPNFAF